MEMTGRRLDGFGRCASSREPAGVLTLTQQKRQSAKPLCRFWRKVRDYLRRHENKMAMTGRRLDGFGRCASSREPPDACTSTVFKFYPASVACRLLVLFNSPNCRKISVLTALLSDTSGFLLSFSIVPCSLVLFLFSVFLTAFCRGFVDCFARIKKFICCFILFLFLTNTRHGAKQIFAYQSNQESV